MMDMSEAKEDETKERKRRVDMAIDMVDKLGEERLRAMFFEIGKKWCWLNKCGGWLSL